MKRRLVLFSVLLTPADHEALSELCRGRGQSKADFLRNCIREHASIPVVQFEHKLSGACKTRHEAKLRKEKRLAKRSKKGD